MRHPRFELVSLRAPLGLSFLLLAISSCSSGEAEKESGQAGTGGTSVAGDGDGEVGDGDSSSGGGATGGAQSATGAASGDGDGSAGSAPVTGAPGCAAAYDGERGDWALQPTLNVGGEGRTYWLWVPPSYDPDVEYPVIFLFHGCGDESNNLPLEDYAGEDAILVRGLSNGPDGCWVTSDDTDSEYFEAMLTAVSAAVCADEPRIFAVGYDSGAELVSRLGCYQAYLIDGVATVAGDNALTYGATCNGPVAALMIHDEDDTEQDIAGSEEVRDRLVDQNFCVKDGIPEPVDPEPCLRYSGCGDPVLWCATSGRGHDRQDDFAAPAIWDFFSSL